MSSGGFGDQAVRTDAAQITLALKRALAALLGLRTGPLFLRPHALPGPFSDQAQWDRARTAASASARLEESTDSFTLPS